MSRKAIPVLVVLALGLAAPADAGDGVIEINQAKALAGGVNGSMASDPPGFPVTITQPGSYRLTGDLTVPDGNTTAISISASNVTIDLGGFSILGPNNVNDSPACSAAGSGVGILGSGEFIVVRNGQVRGMGESGVFINGSTSRIEGVIAIHNCGTGLILGAGSAVIGSQVRRNRWSGINLTGGLIQNSVIYENMENGILAGDGTAVLGCIVAKNKAYGLLTTPGTGVGQTVFYQNVLDASTSANSLGCNLFDGLRLCP